jgi:hypothetical protein
MNPGGYPDSFSSLNGFNGLMKRTPQISHFLEDEGGESQNRLSPLRQFAYTVTSVDNLRFPFADAVRAKLNDTRQIWLDGRLSAPQPLRGHYPRTFCEPYFTIITTIAILMSKRNASDTANGSLQTAKKKAAEVKPPKISVETDPFIPADYDKIGKLLLEKKSWRSRHFPRYRD